MVVNGWLLAVAGSLLALTGIVRAIPAYFKGDYGQVMTGMGLGFLGTLVSTGMGGNLLEWVFHTVSGTITTAPTKPAAQKPHTGGTSSATGALGWVILGIIILAAAAVAVSGASRRRSEGQQAKAARAERWKAVEAEHDEIKGSYEDYLTDVLQFLDRPTLGDVTVDQTVEFLHALDAADDARRGGDIGSYRAKVSELRIAYRRADEHARRVGLNHLPKNERDAVAQARKLLQRAVNSGASGPERQAAYAKARDLLSGVLTVPQQAVAELESVHRLSITAAPIMTTDMFLKPVQDRRDATA